MVGEVSVDGDDAALYVGQLGIMGDNADVGSRSVTIGNRGDAPAHIMSLGGAPVEGPSAFSWAVRHEPGRANSVCRKSLHERTNGNAR